jgi:hypothetical protein
MELKFYSSALMVTNGWFYLPSALPLEEMFRVPIGQEVK